MDVEPNDVARRAAVFAALGEPGRLRVAEHLAVGDATPTELAQRLGVSSNLLAHHLNVLEAAGLVRRVRSEGDRRRIYVRLEGNSTPYLRPPAPGRPERVLFVCTANSARSQLAASLWTAASEVPVSSAGTHPAARVDPGARAAARRHGLRMSAEIKPQKLEEVGPGDLVVTVCDRAHEALGAVSTVHWSVPDPVRIGTAAAFEAAFEDLDDRVTGLAHRLAAVC
ncbi:MarR family transcriptional regulator [Nocardioides halotolerans]|uniref:arsenate reductase/protein-tyrosine-phosphatase family protein n=1 Tax=Nocardioides halotolerans TaxID=433660 RepID=UPI00040DF440|nr:MarR family transcriptional regulator [Nocardioides halotolerans]